VSTQRCHSIPIAGGWRWHAPRLPSTESPWIAVYFALMDDRYPSTDEEQAVHLDLPYPDAEHDLLRGLPLVKRLLAIPHYIVLFFLTISALFDAIFAWFAILFTGRYPRSQFDFIEGVIRWHNRVAAYAFLLITDRYPPFSCRPNARRHQGGPKLEPSLGCSSGHHRRRDQGVCGTGLASSEGSEMD
jgi:hypothetical protein